LSDPVSSYLSGLRLGSPQSHQNLTLIPLLASLDASVEYVSLDEALKSGSVEITEINDGGSVQNLKVTNRSRSKVLILDGEELVGAKQNRISNASFVIPGMAEKVIPVSCIEEGRWRYSSRSFSGTDSMYAARGRRAKLQDTTSMLRVKKEFRSDQVKVWDTVKRYLGMSGASSSTDSFVDYQEHQRADLDGYVRGFSPAPDQVGVMVLINGRLQGLDAFGRKITWQGVFQKLIRSYAMDAIVRTAVEPAPGAGADLTPESFLRAVAEAPRESFDSVGEGKDVRIETETVIGAALVLDDNLLHLTAFPKN
jgi:ARG/rhodanese/phosphatase superfamily protein